jgi:Sulfotransferase domain
LPVFLFDKILYMARRVKRFLSNPENALRRRRMRRKKRRAEYRQLKTDLGRRTRSKKDEFKQLRREVKSERRAEYKQLKAEIAKIENEIEDKKQEIRRIGKELLTVEDSAERLEHERRKQRVRQESDRLVAELRTAKEKERSANVARKKRKKTIQQEIFLLERQRRAVAEGRSQIILDGGGPVPWAEGELGTGALPDFLIIGEKKCGTSFFYYLLSRHPLVQPAAAKELHFFDAHFDLGVEWYRRCFPQPAWKDGRRTITGEASPYMSHPLTPERMAGVVPEARLIALLRNPVDRAYSDYQMVARKGREPLTFEEAIGAAEEALLPGEEGEARADLGDARYGYLSRGIYVDRLLRWTKFFNKEQLLVLQSEDFFENPQETLQRAFDFLGLPEWELEASKLGKKRNAGSYEEGIDPTTRRRLEEYFEPHNQRLYEFLGVDFGW